MKNVNRGAGEQFAIIVRRVEARCLQFIRTLLQQGALEESQTTVNGAIANNCCRFVWGSNFFCPLTAFSWRGKFAF